MDIFKLLSRSTKSTNKSTQPGSDKLSKLPSDGTSANPQLYHDPVPEFRGKKRKRIERKAQDVEAEVPVQEPVQEELNFFASKTEQRPSKSSSKEKSVAERESAPSASVDLELLDEDECRSALRSHRLKVTMLSSKANVVQKPKKSKKPKNEEATGKKGKNDHQQLFPQPLVAFAHLQKTYGISRRLGENLTREGYKIPTEVQMGSLPMLLRPDIALSASPDSLGKFLEGQEVDLLAVAPTGSGKTLAFLIPVVNSMIQRRREYKSKNSHVLEAIIVAPTKELASQIVNEGRKLATGTGIKVVGIQKGMRVVDSGEEDGSPRESSSDEERDDEESSSESDIKTTKKKALPPTARADVLVTTPLVLLHALAKSQLPTVRHLILDEADVLLDPLFREQTLGIWEACVNPGLHVTLWSATMGSNIESLASETIASRRQRLNLDTSSNIVRLVVGLKDSAIPNVSHRLIYAANEPGKLIALRQLLHPTAKSADATQALRPPFLVFTQTIPRAVALHSELLYDIPAEAGGSSRIAVLHSDLSDSARDHVMTRFRNGEIWVLITTDILSRGVDFRGINGVVNYDVPNSGATYIHRVGRTGRAGRDGGMAVTFYTKEDIPYVKNVANIIAASEKQAGITSENGGMQKWLLDALPTPSKNEKKRLKLHGVEARRSGPARDGKGNSRTKISTKSGFERRLENNRKGAIQGSRRRMQEARADDDEKTAPIEDVEWGGFDA